jgi:hypothetical protein
MIKPPFRLAEVLLEPDDAITAVDKSFQPIDAPGHGEHAEPLVAQLATEGLTDPRRCPRDHGQRRCHAHRLPRGREPTRYARGQTGIELPSSELHVDHAVHAAVAVRHRRYCAAHQCGAP